MQVCHAPFLGGTLNGEPTGPWSFPGLIALSIVARLPIGMGAVGLLALGQERNYDTSHTTLLVTAFTVALAVTQPAWGRAVDRRGLPLVLRTAIVVHLSGCLIILLTDTVGEGPFTVLLTACGAGLLGAGIPPVGAAMRATWNRLLSDDLARGRARVAESVIAEGVHILGRLVVAALSLISIAALLPLQAALLTVGALSLARDQRIAGTGPTALGSRTLLALRAAAPLLLLVLVATTAHGCVATVLVLGADGGTTAVGAVLFSAWSLGSLLGGLALLRVGGGQTSPALVPIGLLVFAASLPLLLPALATAGDGPVALLLSSSAVVLLGLPLAPTFTGLYLLAERVAPVGRETETNALLNSTVLIAFGGGSALTGALVGARLPGWGRDGWSIAEAGVWPALACTLTALALAGLAVRRTQPMGVAAP